MLQRIWFWKTSSNVCHEKFVYIGNGKYIFIGMYKIFRPTLMPRMLKAGSLCPFYATENVSSDCYQIPYA